MKSWKARMLVGFMLVAMMLATIAGPALADDDFDNNHRNHHNSFNIFDDNDDNHHNDDFDIDDDDFDFDNNDIFSTALLFAIDDIDCDGVDDDFDGGIDEDAIVCVVEFD